MKIINNTNAILAYVKGVIVLKPGKNELTGEQSAIWARIRVMKGVRERIAAKELVETAEAAEADKSASKTSPTPTPATFKASAKPSRKGPAVVADPSPAPDSGAIADPSPAPEDAAK